MIYHPIMHCCASPTCSPGALVVNRGPIAVMVIKEALQGGSFLGPRVRHSRHVGVVRLRMGIWTCSILSHCFKYASSGNKADDWALRM